jgi:UDP-N-acetylmuramoyl-tripeptide--D-alanyl-D-alanine ligase
VTAPARSGAFRWTLGALARHRRQHLHARVVGVVGSNGKTTTKELIRTALAPKYRVHATEGNHSNPIGVPLTVRYMNSLTW